MDAASEDGTADVARGFGDLVTKLVSEPDAGIYDAWNKALEFVRGRWVLFLGAGDALYAADVLERVAVALDQLPAEITTAYGDVTVFDASSGLDVGTRGRVFRGVDGPWGGGRVRIPCHQGVFQRVRVFDRFCFDRRCRIAADYEAIMRELLANRGEKLDLMIARFESGGVSDKPENRLRMVSESVYINWKLGIFHKRPIYQLVVIAVNAARHLLRRRG